MPRDDESQRAKLRANGRRREESPAYSQPRFPQLDAISGDIRRRYQRTLQARGHRFETCCAHQVRGRLQVLASSAGSQTGSQKVALVPMADASVRHRGHGEDAIYFAADKNRYIGAVSTGFGPDGKRLRRKVSGKTKQEVRDKLRALHTELNVGLQSSAGYTVRAAVDDWLEHGLSGRSARTIQLYRDGMATDRPDRSQSAEQAVSGGCPVGAGGAERSAVDKITAARAQLPGTGHPARRGRRPRRQERGRAGSAACRWRGQTVEGAVGRAGSAAPARGR